MTASEIAVVESTARIWPSGSRFGAAAFEKGVEGQSAVYATHVLDARTDSVRTRRTFAFALRGRREAAGTGVGDRGPG